MFSFVFNFCHSVSKYWKIWDQVSWVKLIQITKAFMSLILHNVRLQRWNQICPFQFARLKAIFSSLLFLHRTKPPRQCSQASLMPNGAILGPVVENLLTPSLLYHIIEGRYVTLQTEGGWARVRLVWDKQYETHKIRTFELLSGNIYFLRFLKSDILNFCEFLYTSCIFLEWLGVKVKG